MLLIPAAGRETMSDRASFLRGSLIESQTNTQGVVTILGSFDDRLSHLDAVMRPTQERTFGIRLAHENIDRTLRSADRILLHFDKCRKAENRIQRGLHEDIEGFMDAVNQLRSSSNFFRDNLKYESNTAMFTQVNTILSKAISKLELEFKTLLMSNSKLLDVQLLYESLPPRRSSKQSGSDLQVYELPTLISPRILPLLYQLVQQLAQSGRQIQCSKIYQDARSLKLEKCVQKFGLGNDKFTVDTVQEMQGSSLKERITDWTKCTRVTVLLLFAAERKLYDKIFQGIGKLNEEIFAEVTSASLRMIVNFVEVIVKCPHGPENLFIIFEMFDVIHELQSDIEITLKGNACAEKRTSFLMLRKQIAFTIQGILGKFPESIEKDPSKGVPSNGKVHPVNSYVMNYLKLLLDFLPSIRVFYKDFVIEDASNPETLVLNIMQALLTNLELKSKQYKDPALAHIFLMNNYHYIVLAVKDSKAKDLLGDDWVQKQRRIVQQNALMYKRESWKKILNALSIQTPGGTSEVSSGVSKEAVKDRFKSFNSQFEEIHQRQSEWIITHSELRESVRLSVNEILQPAYRSFLKRYRPVVERSRNLDKIIKYNPVTLDKMLGDFFEGKSVYVSKR
ncbi:Exocyst complex component EXO70A1 [Zostera marina]|uniref:Exocyst subunit Exo70 family protein n=1 Tax=Zostera marina TaxID=29655 RepID=A0A0K9PKH5_ZOSMR|nr:Exocyst complex component EXO70A1 [Zostera marina]